MLLFKWDVTYIVLFILNLIDSFVMWSF